MTTTDVFARYAALDPAKEPERESDWPAIDTVLLATIDGRTTDVSTQLQPQKDQPRTNEPKWRTAWVAAAAFALVILAGVAILLATNTNNDQNVVDDPQEIIEDSLAPPFDSPMDAARAWVFTLNNGTAEELQALMGDGYVGTDLVGGSHAEIDERMRWDRAVGIESQLLDSCEQTSSASITCEFAVTRPDLGLMTGVSARVDLIIVRIDEDGFVGSTSIHEGPIEEVDYDHFPAFQEWAEPRGFTGFDLDPRADSTGQLEDPEGVGRQYLALMEEFLAELNN